MANVSNVLQEEAAVVKIVTTVVCSKDNILWCKGRFMVSGGEFPWKILFL